MGKRLLVVNPLGTDLYDVQTLDLLAPVVSRDTDLVVRSLGDGVPKTAYLPITSLFYNQLIQAIADAQREGFDAAAIACCSDPALPECKDVVSIPVTAPMEAACHTAPAHGWLTVIAPRIPSGEGENLPQDSNWVRQLVRRYGMLDNLANVRVARAGHPSPDVTASLLEEDPEQLRQLVREQMAESIAGPGLDQARLAYSEDEARSVFFACTLWGGLLDQVRREVPVAVLDPLVTMVKFAELLAWS